MDASFFENILEKTTVVNPESYASEITSDSVSSLGVLGRLFGSLPHSPFNIVGLVLVILLGWVILYSFLFACLQLSAPADSGILTPVKLVELVFPLVSAMIGFLFGHQKQSSN